MSQTLALHSPSLRDFVSVAKPGIIFGNCIAVVGGYFLGAQGNWDTVVFLGTLVGISLVIASASASNNIIDRDIDPLMERTKARPLATGHLHPLPALIFAITLGILGHAVLYLFANPLTSFIAFFGWFAYVVLYSVATKRSTVHGTIVGSLSGAIPPLVGYTAATNQIGLQAILLVLALVFWQMPHSYAIGIFRAQDFRAAGIPLLPLLASQRSTHWAMFLYTVLFAIAVMALPFWGFVGTGFAWVLGIASLAWILLTVRGFWLENQIRWARQVFATSILLVTILSVALVFDAYPLL